MTKKLPRKRVGHSSGGDTDPLSKFKHDYTKDYADPKWPYHYGGMDKGAKFLLVAFPLAIICGITYVYHNAQLKEMIRRPLYAPKIISPMATSAIEDPDRFWGSYQSGLYFGLKTRSKQSPVVGKRCNTLEDLPSALNHSYRLILFSPRSDVDATVRGTDATPNSPLVQPR